MVKYKKTGNYDLVHISYNGMSGTVLEDADREEVKAKVLLLIRGSRKGGHPVVRLGCGEWEVQSPEGAATQGDWEGYLKIKQHVRRYRIILGRRIWLDQ